ncbi:MAG TPA: branched-chain amino acid ABC transporter ATP-binding protein/permease [Acidimicrobiales bacterium]|jgi:ABC-type branched-subunit amino acid transport system ATPase component/ABC-type branched-subunit amino acid transport system permease subunit|nr:branched-chain amino acid ABC transporter ATP-binding protein/permease [Acidimicrobiales bacterium]
MLLCKTRWGRLVTTLIWLAIGLALPVVYGNGVEKLGQLDYILSLVMVGIGLNIVLGFAGQIFLGPSALFAAGGYASAVAATHYTSAQNIYAMCLISVVVSVILAAVIAALTLRVGGFYLGMVTLFIALVIPVVAGQWSLTGGQSGLSLLTILTFTQKPSGYALYVVGVGIVAVMAGFAWAVRSSRLGRRFGSIMASEDLATSIGVAPYWTKLASFLLAAIPIGIAGGYYVYSQQFISPDSVTVQTSIYILAGLVVGGAGTILGPIVGVALVGIAIELLNSFNQYEGLVYGAVLILVAILMPTGIMGVLRDLLARFRPSAMAPPSLEELAAKMGGDTAGGTDAADALAQRVAPAETDTPPLVVMGARRRFGGVMAVDGVDLTVERGRIHALVGPNGSGKTTLLNLITGYYSLDGGSITVGDKRLDTLKGTVPVSRMGIARTFQTPKLNQFETALGNVFAGADRTSLGPLLGTLFHTPRARRDDRKAMAASFVALGDVGLVTNAFDMAGLIPHGTQRLLEIARAMALRPMFVLLDEPAAGLSPAEAEVFKDAVRMMARAGLGVLIVEHNLPIVFDIADEVTVLDEGQVIATGTPAEVSRDPVVVRVYIGRQRLDRPGGEGSSTATLAPGAT